VIYPDNSDLDDDCYQLVPPGVTVHVSRHYAPPFGETSESIHEAHRLYLSGGHIEEGAKRLAPIHCDAVGYMCVSCSLVRDPGHDRRMIEVVEKTARCPATTGTTAIITALRTLGIKRVAFASPYDAGRNELFRLVLSAAGIAIVSFQVLEIPPAVREFFESVGLYRLRHIRSLEVAYRLGQRADCREAEAIVIGSTNFHTGPMIESLEQDLGKPVITGNQATMWHAMRLAGVQESIAGYGRLLRARLS
jgi:maleate cis-trans isomerase